jgi:hypothetical protein
MQTRHVELHVVADPGLEVGEVAVALGEAGQEPTVELEARGGVDRVHPVELVDRLA